MLRKYNRLKYPLIVVLKERVERFYYVATEEEMLRLCLVVVKGRNDDGCYSRLDPESDPPPVKPIPPPEGADKMYTEVYTGALRAWESDKMEWSWYGDQRVFLARALKGDGEAALELIRCRREYQDEGFHWRSPDKIPE